VLVAKFISPVTALITSPELELKVPPDSPTILTGAIPTVQKDPEEYDIVAEGH
jgi:hypothetical protein